MSPNHREPLAPRSLDDEALDWFVRRKGTAFGPGDETAFSGWLETDPAHGRALARWQREWEALEQLPFAARRAIQSRLAIENAMAPARSSAPHCPPSAPPAGSAHSRRSLLWPAAAALAAAVVAATGLAAWNHVDSQPVYAQSFKTRRGEQAEITLPDGSRLRLDTATRLRVDYFRRHRDVQLHEGQAVFSVAADPSRPFRVTAGPVQLTAVGTRFAVRRLPELPGEEGTQVAVAEGRVRVERVGSQTGAASPPKVAQDGGDTIVLAAGQEVSIDRQGAASAITSMPDAAFALWSEHRIRFDDTRLDRALAELGRYGELRLAIRDPAVAALRVTGVFDPRDPGTFARVLPLSLPVRLQDEGGMTMVLPAHAPDRSQAKPRSAKVGGGI